MLAASSEGGSDAHARRRCYRELPDNLDQIKPRPPNWPSRRPSARTGGLIVAREDHDATRARRHGLTKTWPAITRHSALVVARRSVRPEPSLFAPQPTLPAFDIARTGNDLLKACTSTDKDSADALHPYCTGIIVGYYEMLTAFKAKCGDDSKKTAGQIKDVVVKYLKEHPAEHSECRR
jgi:hypothetical protein